MSQTYRLYKKDSQMHRKVQSSPRYKNSDIIAVGEKHVLLPAVPSVGHGHKVSHAKNRTNRLFRPNLHVLRVDADGVTKTVRLSNRDLRTYKKITKVQE